MCGWVNCDMRYNVQGRVDNKLAAMWSGGVGGWARKHLIKGHWAVGILEDVGYVEFQHCAEQCAQPVPLDRLHDQTGAVIGGVEVGAVCVIHDHFVITTLECCISL